MAALRGCRVMTDTLGSASALLDENIARLETRMLQADEELRGCRARLIARPGHVHARQRALHLLAQKRIYDQQLHSLQAQQQLLVGAQSARDQLRAAAAVVSSMRAVHAELRQQHGALANLDELQETLAEAATAQQEVQATLRAAWEGSPDAPDALDAELDAWLADADAGCAAALLVDEPRAPAPAD